MFRKKKAAPVVEPAADEVVVTVNLDVDPNDPRTRDYGDGNLPSLNDEDQQ